MNSPIYNFFLTGLNYLFQTATKAAVSEYDNIEESIARLALTTNTSWLKEHLKNAKSYRRQVRSEL